MLFTFTILQSVSWIHPKIRFKIPTLTLMFANIDRPAHRSQDVHLVLGNQNEGMKDVFDVLQSNNNRTYNCYKNLVSSEKAARNQTLFWASCSKKCSANEVNAKRTVELMTDSNTHNKRNVFLFLFLNKLRFYSNIFILKIMRDK